MRRRNAIKSESATRHQESKLGLTPESPPWRIQSHSTTFSSTRDEILPAIEEPKEELTLADIKISACLTPPLSMVTGTMFSGP